MLAGYVHGPAAATAATAAAVVKVPCPQSVVFVEGISDQIAVEAVAARLGRNLVAERLLVLPVGGAHGIGRQLDRFGPGGLDLPIAGLCDAAEEAVFRHAVEQSGRSDVRSRHDLERLGFYVCVPDLEGELIRAAGVERFEAELASQGDLRSFRTLQKQPAWRGERPEQQLRRFLGSGARRKLRYASLLIAAMPIDRIPRPLLGVLAAVGS